MTGTLRLNWTAAHGAGCYHLDTREANVIIEKRVALHCKKLESAIAVERCCCGKSKSTAHPEKELAEAKALLVDMQAQFRGRCPSGVVRSTAKDKEWKGPVTPVYTDAGMWLYQPIIWNSCGGACGGAVASNAEAMCGGGGVRRGGAGGTRRGGACGGLGGAGGCGGGF